MTTRLALLMVLAAFALVTHAGAARQVESRWTDPAPHTVRFVAVSRGVTLELLDWGGRGRPLLLLAGSGHTAHVFDDLAPALLACCHVYAMTRRGHGLSSRPSTGYDDQQLADDVLRVIEEELLQPPVLVGHSMAGGEMTTLARQHADRVAGLVYLDALGDLEDDPLLDAEWVTLQRQLPAGLAAPPACGPVDRGSFADYRRTSACARGFAFPESELRQMFESAGTGVGPPRMPAWVRQAIGEGQVRRRDYTGIRVPVLALHNGANTTEALLTASGYVPATDTERAAIEAFIARNNVVFGRHLAKLTRHVPDARIVYMPMAGHYLFLTRGTSVADAVIAFVGGLAPQR